jgi:hypothetical protein
MDFEALGNWILGLYDDTGAIVTLVLGITLVIGGLMWSKSTLIDLIQGKWFE